MRGIISNIYGLAVNYRNKKFDLNKKSVYRCPVPVISVGNLSVGGTGKTPFVEMLTHILTKNGHRPAIIGKGYKRKGSGELIVSDGRNILADAESAGDEMFLLAKKLSVPIIINDTKTKAAISACEKFDIDTIIIDDGFQHRSLYRDLDILLIDEETCSSPFLLPKGRLREPLRNISRADVISQMGDFKMVTSTREFLSNEQVIIKTSGKNLKPFKLGQKRGLSHDEISEIRKGIIAISGIANPIRFKNMLESEDFKVLDSTNFKDHQDYSKNDLLKIKSLAEKNQCSNIATTEKDYVKLLKFSNFFEENKINVYVFPFLLTITDGFNSFMKRLKLIWEKKY